MTNDTCHAERVLGSPMLGTCTKPKGHTASSDPAEREHCDEVTGTRWSKAQ